MAINWKDLLLRAMWTFIEAFLIALPTTIEYDLDGAAWKSILLSAAAAGISAVKTFVITWIKSNKPPDGEVGGKMYE